MKHAQEALRWLVIAAMVPVVCVAAPLEAIGVPYAANLPAQLFDASMRWVGGFAYGRGR